MGTFAMTGGATGIGASLRQQLGSAGHQVISVDIKEGDIIADLSTEAGRATALAGIHEMAADGLDGFIPCAGLPPVAPLDLICRVNYFGSVLLVEGLKDLIAKKRGTALLVSSNSAPMVPADDAYVQACLSGDEAAAVAEIQSRADGHTAYAGSKRALTMWLRRNVVAYAEAGLRLNAIAPGITNTPLSDRVMADEQMGKAIKEFGEMVPWGGTAQPEQIANVMRFMLSEEANFVCGAVFFADGGSDAMLRADEF